MAACQTNNSWEELFRKSYYGSYKNAEPLQIYWTNLSLSNNVVDLQALSYGLDALLAMYETTDSLSYLDDAIIIVKNNMRKAKITENIPEDRFRLRDSYKGWIENGKDSTSELYHNETVLSEIYFYQYVSRTLKDIHDNKKIRKKKRYKTFYKETLAFIEKNIWQKWESRGIRIAKDPYNYLMAGRTHMASHSAYIAAELSFLTTSETHKADYLNFVKLYNSRLEKNFIKYGDYIKWNSTWDCNINGTINETTPIIQDVSHANLVVSYIVEAANLGVWKDGDAIQRLINTEKDILWDSTSCIFKDNMDGTFFNSPIHSTVGSFQSDGFVKLARYDQSLFDIFKKFITCTKYVTTWFQYGQLFANLALSEKILKGN